ncbi:hypothetical protein [Actinoplanes sp. NPDC051851]|uniref:hypothetical protein n=1 Tax=Actinoplanes sp. NPDC051851 TaxID=3154753 RepID=UPI00341FBB03
MDDRLTVDLDGLEEFANQLDGIRTTMSDAHHWMRESDDDLGGNDVAGAIDKFESHWSDGRSQVDKNCERLVKLTRQAVDNLRKTDEELAKQLREKDG